MPVLVNGENFLKVVYEFKIHELMLNFAASYLYFLYLQENFICAEYRKQVKNETVHLKLMHFTYFPYSYTKL